MKKPQEQNMSDLAQVSSISVLVGNSARNWVQGVFGVTLDTAPDKRGAEQQLGLPLLSKSTPAPLDQCSAVFGQENLPQNVFAQRRKEFLEDT